MSEVFVHGKMTLAAPYNITATANTTSYLDFVQGVNTGILNGQLGVMIIIVIFAITFLSFLSGGFEVKRSLMGSSFICMILSWLLTITELIKTSDVVVIISCLLAVVIAASFFKT